PLNLAIVLDQSGSMRSQNKIQNAKKGAIDMIRHLNENDIVSLIVFSNSAEIVIPAQHLTDKSKFIRTIKRIRADGGTALYDGLSCATRELRRHASAGYLNRIVLLSDGLANVGRQDNNSFFQMGRRSMGEGIHVSAIGLGLDFNSQLLTGLAENSGGNYYYARHGHQLPEIFNLEINRSITMIAQDIRIRVHAQNGSRTAGVIGPANTVEQHMAETWIPFMYAGDNKYRLIEIDLPALEAQSERNIARLDIQYYDPFTRQTKYIHEYLSVDSSNDYRLVKRSTDKTIVKDSYLRRMAVHKQQAVEYARSGDYQGASRVLIRTSVELQNAAEQYNDADLRRAAEQNRYQSQQIIDEGEYSLELMNSDIMNVNQEFWG
ncbi:MAG: VWA domain-containing protein, partial [Candidatus Omnitrophica bacterium]|nr:VWA domain-containing protein [Candidatus Omnitrophota bacterium]